MQYRIVPWLGASRTPMWVLEHRSWVTLWIWMEMSGAVFSDMEQARAAVHHLMRKPERIEP